MAVNLLIADYPLSLHMLASFSVDEILIYIYIYIERERERYFLSNELNMNTKFETSEILRHSSHQ